MAQPLGCASPPDSGGRFRGARLDSRAVGPGTLGDLLRSLPYAGGGGAALFGGSLTRGGAGVAQDGITVDARDARIPSACAMPGRGSIASHQT